MVKCCREVLWRSVGEHCCRELLWGSVVKECYEGAL